MAATPTLRGGGERILVVDDDPVMRVAVRRMLKQLGYQVLEASQGAEALGIIESTSVRIDLVLTDVVMPDVDGTLLAESVLGGEKAPRVLLMTGYPDDVLWHDREHPGLATLHKPFTLEALARALREVLGDQPSSSS